MDASVILCARDSSRPLTRAPGLMPGCAQRRGKGAQES